MTYSDINAGLPREGGKQPVDPRKPSTGEIALHLALQEVDARVELHTLMEAAQNDDKE